MKNRLWQMLLTVILILLLFSASALADRNWLELEGEGVSVAFQNIDTYTFVTPETLDENMELCLRHGGTEEEIRERFSTGNVVWEAYHDRIEGRIRLEIYEDEWTHYAWDAQTMSLSLFKTLGDDLKNAGWLSDRYDFLTLYSKSTTEVKAVWGSFISQLPYAYESGMCKIHFFNGKAYMFSYTDSKQASKEGHLDQQTHELLNRSIIMLTDYFRRDDKTLANAPQMTDLLPDRSETILNLHSGPYTLKGITEKGASVTFLLNGKETQSNVTEREYKGSVTLADGENSVLIRAEKQGQPQNEIEITLPVNNGMAALTLTEYPNGDTDREKLWVKGFTDPKGIVSVTIDGGKPLNADIQNDGSFKVSFEAEDWTLHELVITASQEGLEDLESRYVFAPVYEDAELGIRAYRKTLDEAVALWKIAEDPEGHVGKRYSFEVQVKSWSVFEGKITMEAEWRTLYTNHAYNPTVYLIFNGYMDDFFKKGQELTVYGEMLDPTKTDPAYPRMQVQYAVYVIGGSRW